MICYPFLFIWLTMFVGLYCYERVMIDPEIKYRPRWWSLILKSAGIGAIILFAIMILVGRH